MDVTHLIISSSNTQEARTSYCGIYKPRYEVDDPDKCQCLDCLCELRIINLPNWIDKDLIRNGSKVVEDKHSYMTWIETIAAAI